jgi:hypothetical protein
MCQVVGAKEVLLFSPHESDEVMSRVGNQKRHTYLARPDEFPEFFALRPYRVRVEETDALHIPIYWWHAVRSPREGLGATVAYTWASPLAINGDRWFSQTVRIRRQVWQTRSLRGIRKMATARAWCSIYRAWHRVVSPAGWDYRLPDES